jgi:hypothetical protein
MTGQYRPFLGGQLHRFFHFSHLNSGIYYLQVNGNGQTYKLIKK